MEQLDRCGPPSWPKKQLCLSTAPTPAGELLMRVWMFGCFFYCKPFVLCLCVDHWSWCTSALEWWKESLCTAMSHPRRCSPTGQITSPMRVFVLADSLVCWTSAAVAKVSIQVKQRVDDLVLLATAYCSCRTGVAQIYSSSLWAVKSW